MADAGGAPSPAPTGLVAPEPDISIVGRFLYTSILYLVALLLVGWRLFAVLRRRRRIQRWWQRINTSDGCAVAALIAATVQLCLLWAAIPYGFGRHNFYLSIDDQIKGGQLVQMSQIPWAWGVALGKISIVLMLGRLTPDPPWKTAVRDMVIIQLLCALTTNIVQLAQCRPIEASWDPTTPETCLDLKIFRVAIYIVGAIAAATDLFLVIILSKLIIPLSMPLHRRILIVTFMGVGVLVAIVVIVKLIYVNRFRKTGDSLYDMVDPATLSVVEVLLGIIAACAPILARPSESLLQRAGLVASTRPTSGSGRINVDDLQAGPGLPLRSLPSKRSSEQGILEPARPGRVVLAMEDNSAYFPQRWLTSLSHAPGLGTAEQLA